MTASEDFPQKQGVNVRMYRQGHGDCFLISTRTADDNPCHVLIDCGYFRGSLRVPRMCDVTENIRDTVRGQLDLVVLTHEHADHLNGITERRFQDILVSEAWLAWTEDPQDRFARMLRKKHNDELLQLLRVRKGLCSRLGANASELQRLNDLLALETDTSHFAVSDPSRSTNKRALAIIKTKSKTTYLNPGTVLNIPKTNIKAYVLGPPRKQILLGSEEPVDDELFSFNYSQDDPLRNQSHDNETSDEPFTGGRFQCIDSAMTNDEFLKSGYADESNKWRCIAGVSDWVKSAEKMALKLNTGINNTSLVLALELPNTKKVLFFPGDAQRGSWVSWSRCRWSADRGVVTARDLLANTVLYKVAHHGSHNATLDGCPTDNYPNLSWFGAGRFRDEFVVMLPACEQWAKSTLAKPVAWEHPLPAIKDALMRKSLGRVLQTDECKNLHVGDDIWSGGLDVNDLYYDYFVRDGE